MESFRTPKRRNGENIPLDKPAGKSTQRPEIKDEVFYIQSGKVIVKYSMGDDILRASEKVLGPGDNFHVFRGLRHRIIALEDTQLFEFSTQHFDSDSHRIEKGD